LSERSIIGISNAGREYSLRNIPSRRNQRREEFRSASSRSSSHEGTTVGCFLIDKSVNNYIVSGATLILSSSNSYTFTEIITLDLIFVMPQASADHATSACL